MENSRAYESFDFGYQKFDTSKDDSFAHFRTGSHPSLAFSYTANENGSTDKSSSPLGRSLVKTPTKNQPATLSRLGMKQHSHVAANEDDEEDIDIELEMMKDKFSKLLLGEDMSGSGNSVCSAVAISNSITNLYATVFGQNLRLEPLPPEKKSMWKREMDYLLSVCDYIVEFSPAFENLEDGTSLEMMTSKLRSDIYMNLPALRKLDNMLLEILESFRDTEFWYAERGSFSSNANVATNIGSKSDSFRKITQRKEEKWWLPVPCVPPGGISDKARKHLQHKRDCANQIHKAAMAINNCILAEMQVPDTYMTNLPKTGRTSLGDTVYRYISTTDKFSPEYVLDCIDIKSEHEALEVADKIEASIYIWRRKAVGMISSKSSWNVMDLKIDFEKVDKNLLASRAESLLMYLKQRHPGLSQTTLDTSKIQDNKDVGQAILESYSRVLEGLAFNIVAWVDDVLYADNSAKEQVN